MDIFEAIILPAIIFTAIAVVIAIALELTSKKLEAKQSKEEQVIKSVMDTIGNYNCGKCGYAGCRGYSTALLDGKDKLGLCVPMRANQDKYDSVEKILQKVPTSLHYKKE